MVISLCMPFRINRHNHRDCDGYGDNDDDRYGYEMWLWLERPKRSFCAWCLFFKIRSYTNYFMFIQNVDARISKESRNTLCFPKSNPKPYRERSQECSCMTKSMSTIVSHAVMMPLRPVTRGVSKSPLPPVAQIRFSAELFKFKVLVFHSMHNLITSVFMFVLFLR